MNRKNKFLSAFFSLAIFFVCSLLFCACGSSVDMSSVKSAEDIEREKNVSQYKPQPKKEETKPQPTSKEPTRKTTETKHSSTTSNPERTQPASSVSNRICIPDFMAFTNNTAYQIDTEIGAYNETHISYVVDANKSAIQEYIKLIGKYGFKQTAFEQTSDVGIYEYGFVYTGEGEIGTFQRKFNKKKEKLHFNILWYALGNDHKDEFQIRYGDGINYVDTGDRTSYKLNKINRAQQSSSGGGSSFDYPSGPELKPTEITDVACARCGGLGYIEEFTYDTSTPHYDGSPPPAGVTIRKSCPDCGGSGRKRLNW